MNMKRAIPLVVAVVCLVGCSNDLTKQGPPTPDSSSTGGSDVDVDAGGSPDDTGGATDAGGLGQACTSHDECESGFCPPEDGVCCDMACDGSCVSCAGSKTGESDGRCAPVAADTDPDAECADQGAESCQSNGAGCNGDAAAPGCRMYPVGTECAASTCTEGQQTTTGTCDGDGTCVVGEPSACAPYTCAADSCRTACDTTADCAGDTTCLDGSCTLLPDGSPCSREAECASGHCADGVCCDAACDTICVACDQSGTEGQCTSVPAETDPEGECPSGEVCDGSGACHPPCAGGSPTLDSEEQAFLAELNAYRTANGLNTLESCTSLARAAQGHSEDMRDQDYYGHTGLDGSTPWERACDACYEQGCGPSTEITENIAAGNSSGQATFTQWKNSPGHNANMLDSTMTQIGIGRATGGGTYGVYWTTVFAAADEASCD